MKLLRYLISVLIAGVSIAQAQYPSNGGGNTYNPGGGGGSGTVTSVSVVTNNGVSGSVATATTTPAITLTLGAITPTTVNGNTFTTGTYTLTGAAAKTLTFNNSITLAGTDSTTMTFPSTNATLARTDAANTFTGHQTIEGVTSTGATGTGALVFATSPTLVTPALGGATATSITISASAGTTGATNAPSVGSKLYFTPFTNGTTTSITLPGSPASGNNFTLYALACNGTSTFTTSGNVQRFGGSGATITLITPAPSGDHKLYFEYVNGIWFYSDDIFASPLTVAAGGTGLTSGTSGGVLAYTASGTLASSGVLTQYGVVVGGGAGAVPQVTAAGAADTVLTGNGSANPTYQYPHIHVNSQSAAYTTLLTDQGDIIYHPSADTTARTWTIDSNANVAAPIGTSLSFYNDTSAGTVTIAITSDTLVLSPAGTTGSVTLLAGHTATAVKVASTRWFISMN
jgi:hypothetical protein